MLSFNDESSLFLWLECNHDKNPSEAQTGARGAQNAHFAFLTFFNIFEKRLFVGVPAKCILFYFLNKCMVLFEYSPTFIFTQGCCVLPTVVEVVSVDFAACECESSVKLPPSIKYLC